MKPSHEITYRRQRTQLYEDHLIDAYLDDRVEEQWRKSEEERIHVQAMQQDLDELGARCWDAEQTISYLEDCVTNKSIQNQAMQQELDELGAKCWDAEQTISYLEDCLTKERELSSDLQMQVDKLKGRHLECLPLHELVMLSQDLIHSQQRVNMQLAEAAAGGQCVGRWQWQADDGIFQDYDCEACLQIERHAKVAVSNPTETLQIVNQGRRIKIRVGSLEQEVVGSSAKRRRIRRADEILIREPSWVQQIQEVQLVPVELDTSDYVKVLNAAFSDLPGSLRGLFALTSVQRVQNTFLWRKFEAERQNLIRLRGGNNTGERTLFHGTRAHSPFDIVLKREGFMVDHAGDGLYGKGLYFAERPQYSHNYAHRTRDKHGQVEFHMLMCRVLCGLSRRMGSDVDRTMSRLKLPPTEYDSVEGGPHQPRQVGPGPRCSMMYVVYQDTQIYPEFVFTYREANLLQPWLPDVPNVAA